MATFTTLFKNRTLLILGASESVSNIGNWITMMAVYALVIFRSQGGVVQSSGIYLAGLLPTLLFSPAAGWLCDRFDRRTLMIASELTSGLIVSGIIFVQQLGWIYALLALEAISISIMTPARQAVVPDILPQEELTRANAFLQQLNGIVKITAPLFAGLLLTVLTPHQAIILDVISFILSAVILSRLPSFLPHPTSKAESQIAQKDNAPGLSVTQVVRTLPGLRLLFLSIFLAIFIVSGFDILSPIYTRDVLHGSESLFGLLVGLIGIGTLAAAFVLMVRKAHVSPWRDILLAILLVVLLPGSMAIASWLPGLAWIRAAVLLGCLMGGVGSGLAMVQSGTLLQLLSPASMLGRIGGIYQSVLVAGQLAGILLTPLLVPSLLPMESFFGLSALALLLLWLYVGQSIRSMPQSNPEIAIPDTGEDLHG